MRTFTLAVLLSLVTACSAQQAPPAGPTFTPERFRAHVAFLADDLLEGRDTGSRGHEIAARYVASQFDSFGLKPGGENGGWFQQVTLQRTVRSAGAFLSIDGPQGEQTFKHADHVLIGIHPRESKLDLSAPMAFVGFGVEDARLGLDDYRGLDVKGCVVVALRGFPKGLPSEEGAHIGAQKEVAAEKHGAIGLLSIATLQSEKAVPWER